MKFACILPIFAAFCLVSARPQGQPQVQLKEGCREGQLFNCATPIISFFLSGDGQRLAQMRDTKAQLAESDYNNVCRLGQNTISCLDAWVDKCVPQDVSGIHLVSNGAVELVNTCNETGAYDKVTKLTQCSEKMKDVHTSCGNAMKAKHQNLNYKNPKVLLARDNLQKDLCCNLKAYNECFSPSVPEKCGQEGAELFNGLRQRISSAFQCSEAILSSCPAA